MKRREFIRSLALLAGASLLDIDRVLIQTAKLTDEQFVAFVTYQMNLWVSNPAQCAFIDSIEESE